MAKEPAVLFFKSWSQVYGLAYMNNLAICSSLAIGPHFFLLSPGLRVDLEWERYYLDENQKQYYDDMLEAVKKK